jgi:hypothetical protein
MKQTEIHKADICPHGLKAATDAYIGLLATPATGDIEDDIIVIISAYEKAKAGVQ